MSRFSSKEYLEIPIIHGEKTGYWEIYSEKKIWHDYKKMKFQDYPDSEDKYGISGGDWMTLEAGDNKIRIVSEFMDYAEHYDNEKKRSFICLGKENCPYCQAGDKPRVRYLGWVIDRKDSKIKLLRIGHSIFKQIGVLAKDEEYGFEDLPEYDMTIKKTGTGLDTEYSVVPARNNSPLTETEKTEIEKTIKDPNEIIESMKQKIARKDIDE